MLHGILLVDKPAHKTSHDIVDQVRRWTGQKAVGHAGTLDPLATGLLVLLLGEATKISDYVLNGDKSYLVTALLGVKTTTGDTDGEVLERSSAPVEITQEKIQQAVCELQGSFQWPVPMYSAVKVQGKKLYDMARSGQEAPPLPSRPMIFYSTELVAIAGERVTVRLHCSKGSFVRTWVEKLGEKLGTLATVAELRRETSEPYSIEQALMWPETATNEQSPRQMAPWQGEAGSHWVPLQKTLPGFPQLMVDGLDEKLIKNGQIPHGLKRLIEVEFAGHPSRFIKVLSRRGQGLLALLAHDEQKSFKIQRVFSAQTHFSS